MESDGDGLGCGQRIVGYDGGELRQEAAFSVARAPLPLAGRRFRCDVNQVSLCSC